MEIAVTRIPLLPRAAALAFAALALGACSRAPAPAARPAPATLETLVVAPVATPQEAVWDGVIEAVNATTLAAQTNARVKETPVDVGERVRAGDVLLRFSDVEQDSARRSARALVAAARATYAEAQADWQRLDEVYARKLVARADLDRATARRDAARAALASAEAALASAGQVADYTVVRAPFDGVVTARLVEVGQAVQAGPPQPQPLIALAALDALRAEVRVPQETAEAIRARGVAAILLPDGTRIAASEVQVLPTADPASHSFPIRVTLPASTAGLWPGMTVRVAFALGEGETLALPATSIVRRGELDGAYVLDAEGQPRLRMLRLGHARDGEVEILAGLAAGERVALDPAAAMQHLRTVQRGGKAP